MFKSDDSHQLGELLEICSEALIELNIVPKDEYNNGRIDNNRIITRLAQNFFANMITKEITELTKNLNYEDKDFNYVRDKFFVSDDSEQFDYLVAAVQPGRPMVMTTDSYNLTIHFVWGVHNIKTKLRVNNYILEERQDQNGSIYSLSIFDDEKGSVPSHIYGTNLPMDVYYSTKLVLIHTLTGKGYLAKYKIDDVGYVMILTNDEHTAKIKAKQSTHNKQTIDRKQYDL
ncbi:unnamed protein product [Adineta steineri]|uniref:Uncharacterized protein n=1 Tax=Adineta steineri TaxID=433720 RepID=A0A813M7T6_9BILA|nr:unnamed protein product [Adineta steineri]CAF4100770.1 unnamed protein product [Adineta steineri]